MLLYPVYSCRRELWFGPGVHNSTEKQILHLQFHMPDDRKNFLQDGFWLLEFQAWFSFTFCMLSVLGDTEHLHTVIRTLDQYL